MSILELPPEVLGVIGRMLDSNARVALGKTCSYLRTSMLHADVWKNVIVTKPCMEANDFLVNVARDCTELHVGTKDDTAMDMYRFLGRIRESQLEKLRHVSIHILCICALSPFKLFGSLRDAACLESLHVTISHLHEDETFPLILIPSKPSWGNLRSFSYIEQSQRSRLAWGTPAGETVPFMKGLRDVKINCRSTDFWRHAHSWDLDRLYLNCPFDKLNFEHTVHVYARHLELSVYDSDFMGVSGLRLITKSCMLHVMHAGYIHLTGLQCDDLHLRFYGGAMDSHAVVWISYADAVNYNSIRLSSAYLPCPAHNILFTDLPRDLSSCFPIIQKLSSDFAFFFGFEQDPWLDVEM
jgi:hypothetical protein